MEINSVLIQQTALQKVNLLSLNEAFYLKINTFVQKIYLQGDIFKVLIFPCRICVRRTDSWVGSVNEEIFILWLSQRRIIMAINESEQYFL